MPFYTLFDTTGTITGVINVDDVAHLAPYLTPGIQKIDGYYDPDSNVIDTANGNAVVPRVKTLAEAKEVRKIEAQIIRGTASSGVVTTASGDFEASQEFLTLVSNYCLAGLFDSSFTPSLRRPDGTTANLTLTELRAVQRDIAQHIATTHSNTYAAEAQIDAAVDIPEVEAVVINGGSFYQEPQPDPNDPNEFDPYTPPEEEVPQ